MQNEERINDENKRQEKKEQIIIPLQTNFWKFEKRKKNLKKYTAMN